jgi:hypothetical protein
MAGLWLDSYFCRRAATAIARGAEIVLRTGLGGPRGILSASSTEGSRKLRFVTGAFRDPRSYLDLLFFAQEQTSGGRLRLTPAHPRRYLERSPSLGMRSAPEDAAQGAQSIPRCAEIALRPDSVGRAGCSPTHPSDVLAEGDQHRWLSKSALCWWGRSGNTASRPVDQ